MKKLLFGMPAIPAMPRVGSIQRKLQDVQTVDGNVKKALAHIAFGKRLMEGCGKQNRTRIQNAIKPAQEYLRKVLELKDRCFSHIQAEIPRSAIE